LGGTPGWVCNTFNAEREFPGFGLIAVSRPGYCRTPMTAESKTAVGQADLMLALMDFLNVEKCVVYGVSGGGPIALNMAR